MNRKQQPTATKRAGFTLVELLTVIALIITIAALAVPNFAAMIREHHWTAAIGAMQAAIMRAKAYAVNDEIDYAVEFYTDEYNVSYLRIEAESAYLEHIPNLEQYLALSDTLLAMPLGWYHAFMSRRDAWGPDGNRLWSGMFDCYRGGKWGSIRPDYDDWFGHSTECRLSYDERYSHSKGALTWPWNDPAPGNWRAISSGERSNVTGPLTNGTGYLDVNDDYNYIYQSTEHSAHVRDNLAADDYFYLPHDLQVDLSRSTLINFDAARSSSGVDVANHGWDGTHDLRFGKSGHLLQTQAAEIVISRKDGQAVKVRLLRGTGRLKKVP